MSAKDVIIRKDPGEDWVEHSRKTNVLLFSELHMLLRALDRFFTVEHLTASNDDLTTGIFTMN